MTTSDLNENHGSRVCCNFPWVGPGELKERVIGRELQCCIVGCDEAMVGDGVGVGRHDAVFQLAEVNDDGICEKYEGEAAENYMMYCTTGSFFFKKKNQRTDCDHRSKHVGFKGR